MPLLTHSALLRALGWTLFNSLWQMSLLWAFYHLLLLVFRNFPSRARHGLVLLLLAFGACWSVKTFVSAYFFSAGPWLSTLIPAPQLSAHGLYAVLETGRRGIDFLLPWCSTLYLLILGGLLVHYSRHFARSRQILYSGLSRMAPEFRVFVSSTARRMGIRKTVNVHGSSLVDVPVTLGFLRPVILLPVSLITQLTPAQIEAILVHELAHIYRKDYLLNLVVSILELLFFFNPFTRGLIAQLKKEREHCCDEQVLEFRYDPHIYVSALLSLARQHGQGRLAVAATGGGEKLLLQRARKMLQHKRTDDRPGPRLLLLMFLTTVMGIVMLGLSRPSATDRPAPATQTATPPATASYLPISSVEQIVIYRQIQTQIPVQARTTGVTAAPRRHRIVLHRSSHPATPTPDPLDQMMQTSMARLDPPAADKSPVTSFAGLVEITRRDYSMDKSTGTDAKPVPQPETADQGQPFVPHSSFSFQYTDTIPPEIKLAMMQELTQQELRVQIFKLQAGLGQALATLKEQEASLRKALSYPNPTGLANFPDRRQLEELQQLEKRLQQDYRLNMENLRRQLQKASRRITIVYI